MLGQLKSLLRRLAVGQRSAKYGDNLRSPKPTVGHIQCSLYCIPTPNRTNPSGVVIKLTTILGNLISGSLRPPFRLVNQSTILSVKCPPIYMPTSEPTMAEKKQRPVCQASNPYAVLYAGATLDVTATRNPMVTDMTREPHNTEGRIIRASGRIKRLESFSDV